MRLTRQDYKDFVYKHLKHRATDIIFPLEIQSIVERMEFLSSFLSFYRNVVISLSHRMSSVIGCPQS
jgi:hypothetical protein